jgi:4-hydroxy-tetrahydrodipicolinate reductase
MVNVIVNGAFGKMGQEAAKAISAATDLDLVASLGRGDDLAAEIARLKADVVLDLTTPGAVFDNAVVIINAGARPVIGTTGLSEQEISQLTSLCETKKRGGMIVPNFAIGAVLAMRFAEISAKYFEYAEIIEMHHEEKADAPSGTAMKAAQMISAVRPNKAALSTETVKGAMGARVNSVPVHSVRMPGLLAHLQVMFGSEGQTLTIRHDALGRDAFMPGIVLSCQKVMLLNELVYGLEHVVT